MSSINTLLLVELALPLVAADFVDWLFDWLSATSSLMIVHGENRNCHCKKIFLFG